MLKRLGEDNLLTIRDIYNPFYMNDETISSDEIRKILKGGKNKKKLKKTKTKIIKKPKKIKTKKYKKKIIKGGISTPFIDSGIESFNGQSPLALLYAGFSIFTYPWRKALNEISNIYFEKVNNLVLIYIIQKNISLNTLDFNLNNYEKILKKSRINSMKKINFLKKNITKFLD